MPWPPPLSRQAPRYTDLRASVNLRRRALHSLFQCFRRGYAQTPHELACCDADILIAAAAVADYRPVTVADQKIKKHAR